MAKNDKADDGTSRTNPDPEVSESKIKKRRYHTVGYKLKVLREVEECQAKGEAVGAYLRKEGLYSSHISEWKKSRDNGLLDGTKKRGPQSEASESAREILKLKSELSRVRLLYEQSVKIIETQKKIAEIIEIAVMAKAPRAPKK